MAIKINFIPNDPLAVTDSPMRKKTPLPNRPSSRAGFTLAGAIPAGLYSPGTPGFVHWQCREAALLAVKTWEGLDGALSKWARAINVKRLDLVPDQGVDLNAYYNGHSLSFFHATAGNKTTYSGASTDVVAHEVGHAILDTIRPDLWSSNLTETGAFHEAFGDCLAIVAALSDSLTRSALLQKSPTLDRKNFVETTAEDLSDGVRRDHRYGPTHAASKPRRALNDFKWRLPTTLPTTGGPGDLTSEVHSFARVFSGCFYDCIRNVFGSVGSPTEAKLWTATQKIAQLLIVGARQAPETPRFFQAVGRAMVLADQSAGGHNVAALRDAFTRHGLELGSNAMLMPRASLAGGAAKLGGGRGKAILSRSTLDDLRARMQATESPLHVQTVEIAGQPLAQAVHRREVPLGDVSPLLKGVVARVAESVLVGNVGRRGPADRAVADRPAIVSALPEPQASTDEVYTFVESLLKNDAVSVDEPRARRAIAGRGDTADRPLPTHAVHAEGGKRVLVRVRFR